MRTVFSSWAYRDAAGDLDRAEATLVFAALAGVVPALLGWLLDGIAASAAAAPLALPTLVPVLTGVAALVRWLGLGVLTLAAPVYLGLSLAQYRRGHGQAPELSAWALAEVYVAAAVVALLGFVWLT